MHPVHWIFWVALAFAAIFTLRRVLGGGLSPARLKELKDQGAILVDVRTSAEFAQGHAPGSLNIPLDQLSQRMGELERSQTILLCCASGARSLGAQKFLQRAGFTQAYSAGSWRRLL